MVAETRCRMAPPVLAHSPDTRSDRRRPRLGSQPSPHRRQVPIDHLGVGLARYCGSMPSCYRDPRAPTPKASRRVAVAAVFERDGAIVQGPADGGDWDFLGGAVDEAENVLDALRREVREETGRLFAEETLFGVFSDPTRIIFYPDGHTSRLFRSRSAWYPSCMPNRSGATSRSSCGFPRSASSASSTCGLSSHRSATQSSRTGPELSSRG